jgi:hypothetical protein
MRHKSSMTGERPRDRSKTDRHAALPRNVEEVHERPLRRAPMSMVQRNGYIRVQLPCRLRWRLGDQSSI